MDGKTLARIGAVALVGVAATIAAIQMNDRQPAPPAFTDAPRAVQSHVDPLHRLLLRCQRLGAAATRDPICLKAWADNRRHFLDPDAPLDGESSVASEDDPIRKETMPMVAPQAGDR